MGFHPTFLLAGATDFDRGRRASRSRSGAHVTLSRAIMREGRPHAHGWSLLRWTRAHRRGLAPQEAEGGRPTWEPPISSPMVWRRSALGSDLRVDVDGPAHAVRHLITGTSVASGSHGPNQLGWVGICTVPGYPRDQADARLGEPQWSPGGRRGSRPSRGSPGEALGAGGGDGHRVTDAGAPRDLRRTPSFRMSD